MAYFGFVDTVMVQQAFEEGRAGSGHEPGDAIPAFMLRRITPVQAGEALARGIERRRPRVIEPRWWTVGSVLRGIVNPAIDYLATRAPRVQDALRDADAAGSGPPPEQPIEEVVKEEPTNQTGPLPSAPLYEQSI